MSDGRVDVSVLIPVLNEAEIIEQTTEAMLEQRFDGGVELIFLDGESDDGTRPILEKLARREGSIRVLDNPEKRVPHALNIGLRASRGEFVARMDAHTFYPRDYLAAGIDRLRRGGVEWVSGPQIAYGDDRWSRAVALALGTRLGVGGAKFRYPVDHEIEVDTGFTGVWRRAALEARGGWDEAWPVNQDAELAARVRADGGRIVCIPAMAGRYQPRSSLRSLARQYWRYGQYRAKTSGRHPESMRPSHMIAPTLVATLAAALGPRAIARPARAGLGVYAATLAAEALHQAARGERELAPLLPLVLATMHLSWGAGFWLGSAKFGFPARAIASALTRRRAG
jgi:glycosyltransferase involved in cell wall biosynthesis